MKAISLRLLLITSLAVVVWADGAPGRITRAAHVTVGVGVRVPPRFMQRKQFEWNTDDGLVEIPPTPGYNAGLSSITAPEEIREGSGSGDGVYTGWEQPVYNRVDLNSFGENFPNEGSGSGDIAPDGDAWESEIAELVEGAAEETTSGGSVEAAPGEAQRNNPYSNYSEETTPPPTADASGGSDEPETPASGTYDEFREEPEGEVVEGIVLANEGQPGTSPSENDLSESEESPETETGISSFVEPEPEPTFPYEAKTSEELIPENQGISIPPPPAPELASFHNEENEPELARLPEPEAVFFDEPPPPNFGRAGGEEEGAGTLVEPTPNDQYNFEEAEVGPTRRRKRDSGDYGEESLEAFQEEALNRFNEYRAQVGAPELVLDEKLNDGAKDWAEVSLVSEFPTNSCDICSEYTETFAHRRINSWRRQLPVGQAAADWVMKRWFNKALSDESSGYGLLLRREKLTRMGIGIAYAVDGSEKEMFVVGRFA